MQRGLFLDRDGVLNEPVSGQNSRERSPWFLDELRLFPDSKSAIDTAVSAGLVPIIVTNQPDLARGNLDANAAMAIRDAVLQALPGVIGYYWCPHSGEEGCTCRKPAPGMLNAAAKDLCLDLTQSWLIGDRWVDIAAAQAVGVRSVLVERENSWSPSSAGSPPTDLRPTLTADSVSTAVQIILSDSPSPRRKE